MGTSLTGLTPATTYDALIKVGDNGPLSATAKVLSDGLGNDSPIAMSTTLVGIGTATPTLGKLSGKDSNFQYIAEPADTATFGYLGVGHFSNGAFIGTNAGTNTVSDILRLGTTGTERMRIDASGNVGIGTSAPTSNLHVNTAATAVGGITLTSAVNSNGAAFLASNGGGGSYFGRNSSTGGAFTGAAYATVVYGGGAYPMSFYTNDTERMRILSDGGLTFNGDTSQANALDDYEEGTWTPVLRGSSTPGTYELGTTYGNYTKIGRQVTLNAVITLSGSITGGGLGYLQITGVPFTKSSTQEALGSCWFVGVDFTGSFVVPRFVATSATSTLYFIETVDNANPIDLPISGISASDVLNLSITYFV